MQSAGSSTDHVEAKSKAAPSSSWAAQLRPKKKNGNEDIDLANESNFTLLQTAVHHCDSYPGDIVHLHSFVNKLAKKHTVTEHAAETLSVNFNQWGTLKSLPEDYVGAWVISKSDLTAEDLQKARNRDKEATYILASAGSQIPLKFRLPDDLNSHQILTSFLDLRFDKTGKRIQNFKRDGRLKEDGSLDFVDLSFKLKFKEEPSTELDTIGHVMLGDQTVPSPGAWATTASDYESFWSDFCASIKIPGMPKVAMHTYFGPNTSKFGYPPCNLKNAGFKADVAACVKTHADKAAAVKLPAESDSPLKVAIEKADKDAAKDKMKSIQAQMQAKVAERKNKRKLAVSSPSRPAAKAAAAAPQEDE